MSRLRDGAGRPRFEGYTPDELVALPRAEWDALVLNGEPIAFRVGSAEVLGQFRVRGDVLVVDLAHIDGGGEGVLVAIWSLAARLALHWRLAEVEWLVHAVACANPNPRLRRLLERRGFTVTEHPDVGTAYLLRRRVDGGSPFADVPDDLTGGSATRRTTAPR